MRRYLMLVLSTLSFMVSTPVMAMQQEIHQHADMTQSFAGYLCLFIFVVAYLLVILEEKLHLRKSKPVLLGAGLIWLVIAIAYQQNGYDEAVETALRHNFLEYAELFFFLLVAMTYINAMIERGVFEVLREWLVSRGFTYRSLFWLTGILAFFISPVADNLTTALIMCTVVLTVGSDKPKFVAISCINIVVAANAGGAFSPFGDITTLMVWQKGLLPFADFFKLFIPSIVNFLVPAIIMQFAIPSGTPAHLDGRKEKMKEGGMIIVGLFLLTIVTAVSFHNFLHLPPVIGMMTGLAFLGFYGYRIKKRFIPGNLGIGKDVQSVPYESISDDAGFDIFSKVAGAEWDTLLFFYGVILSVGGLGFIGYLGVSSEFIYGELGPTIANTMVGIMSSIIDNIPVMFAVLTMNPEMPEVQWLLVTLTAGVGGSLLSIGSAAGVALMGQARGRYTFFSHLKWTPVIALGYAASIYVHFLVNG